MFAPTEELKFVSDWYEQLIENGNEKLELAHFIKDFLIENDTRNLLEIGMGTRPIFSNILANHIDKYTIVEKEPSLGIRLASNVTMVQQDFEKAHFESTFDLIILSHVIYYFSDLEQTIKKTMRLLNKNGKVIFVVNGTGNDYGRLKQAFANISGTKFIFTYKRLHEIMQRQGLKFKEYTIQTCIRFDSYQALYERLRLFFDLFPEKYSQNKHEIINWLKNSIKSSNFLMDQKIIVVRNPFDD